MFRFSPTNGRVEAVTSATRYDAFKINDPRNGIPDVKRRVSDERFNRRLDDLTVLDREFARGRIAHVEQQRHCAPHDDRQSRTHDVLGATCRV